MKTYKCFIEELMFLTVKITNSNGGEGTGFFYEINFDNNDKCRILVTNQHVINYNKNEEVVINFHMHQGKNNALANIKFRILAQWFFVDSKDICFCFVKAINNEIKNILNKSMEIVTISKDFIITDSEIEDLAPLDELVMVGYPAGLYNERYNLPIFRKGYIASNPAVDFNIQDIGIVDMPCFPGSSGSPIFTYSNSFHISKNGQLKLFDSYKLLGILFASPLCDGDGIIHINNIPTKLIELTEINVIMHLGYYINGKVLLEIEDIVKHIIENCDKYDIKTEIMQE